MLLVDSEKPVGSQHQADKNTLKVAALASSQAERRLEQTERQ